MSSSLFVISNNNRQFISTRLYKHQKYTFTIERINTNKSPFHQSLIQPKYSRNKKSAGEHFLPSNFKQSISTSTLLPSPACYHNWSPTLLERKDRRNSAFRRDWRNIGSEIIFNKRRNLAPISFVPSSSLYLNHVATLQLSSSFVKSRQKMLETR